MPMALGRSTATSSLWTRFICLAFNGTEATWGHLWQFVAFDNLLSYPHHLPGPVCLYFVRVLGDME